MSLAAARNHPTTRAGGQDDVSSRNSLKKFESYNFRYVCSGSRLKMLNLLCPTQENTPGHFWKLQLFNIFGTFSKLSQTHPKTFPSVPKHVATWPQKIRFPPFFPILFGNPSLLYQPRLGLLIAYLGKLPFALQSPSHTVSTKAGARLKSQGGIPPEISGGIFKFRKKGGIPPFFYDRSEGPPIGIMTQASQREDPQ